MSADGASPITRFSVGAAMAPYLSISAVRSGAAGLTSRRTMTLLMVALTISLVARLITRSMSVTTRPTEAAPVTMIPVPAKSGQLSAQFVCPVTTRSISRSMRVMTSVIAVPVGLLHWLTVVSFRRASGAALVEQDDDRLDALRLEDRDQRVDRIGLVMEVDVRRGRRGHDVGRALEGHAHDGDIDAGELVDGVRREDRLAGVLVGDVGGEELEVGALEAVAREAAFDRVAATLLHPGQLVGALVELVVPDAVVVEAHEVHGLDRRLVVEDRRDEGRGTDHVTRRHEQRVLRVRRLEVAHVAARGTPTPPAGVAPMRPPELVGVRRPELAVEVVEAEDLDRGRLRFVAAGPSSGGFAQAAGTAMDATMTMALDSATRRRNARERFTKAPPGMGARPGRWRRCGRVAGLLQAAHCRDLVVNDSAI